MRVLLATTTCLTPLVLIALAAPAMAETVINAKRTTGVQTSTVKAGAADDIKIVAAGSIEPTSGVAVTIDSANKVTNEGTIKITNANGAIGILANAGTAGTITNSGTITIDESYTPTDTDNDGDIDGPLASGNTRFGIRTAGAFTGNIVNSGTITIEGNDSAGIALGGPLTGALTTNGTITVTGDRSAGVRAGDISGPVRVAGSISARGKDAVGAAFTGDVGGALVVQGGISATGYRTTTPPADVSKLDADDLLQGGPALLIAGNVAGGVILAVPPKDNSTTDTDEDDDGIPDANEGSAAVVSYGSAAAVQIGAAGRAVTLGPVAGTGRGLVIDGAVAGLGVYNGVAANGTVVGGLGGTVSIAGGIAVNGTVEATSVGASATGVRIGSGASTPEIKVAGVVTAAGGGSAASKTTAIRIDAGGNVAAIRNSGQIKAAAGGTDGTATAISDASGSVTLVENSGSISATGALATSARNVAIDLSANGTGATVRQIAGATGAAAPSITGDIVFGGGDDRLEIGAGQMTGSARFGAGSDTMTLGGGSTFAGTADFGGGTDALTLSGGSRFTGSLANSQGLALSVASGRIDLAAPGTVALRSLAVGGQGVLGVIIDGAAHSNTLFQTSGAASFAAGSKVALTLRNVASSEGRYVIVRAGSIDGAGNLGVADALLPFMYKGSVATTGPANEIAINIGRKSTTELGLNRSQVAAYDAIYAVLDEDAKVAGAFLDIQDGDRFRKTLRQMLPDHAGGTFETVTSGSRATARFLGDPTAPFSDQGNWGFWLQQVAWGTSADLAETASYDVTGWGAAGGGEVKTGVGNFGLSLAYLAGEDDDGDTDNEVTSNQFELAAYWRGAWGGFRAHARASAAHIDFKGKRHFAGMIGTEEVERNTRGKWKGRLLSASGGLAYEHRFGRLSLRPIAAVDYYRLREGGYSETGGGEAFDLIVGKRRSDELAVTGTIAAGLNFGGQSEEGGWFRAEIEGGRRHIVGGKLGHTTAHFAGGEAFTLVPEERTNGWVGKLRGVGGTSAYRLGGEFSAEEQQGRAAVALRVSLQIGL